MPMGIETPLALEALTAFARLSSFGSDSRIGLPTGVLVWHQKADTFLLLIVALLCFSFHFTAVWA